MIVLDTNVVSELIRPVPSEQVLDWVDAQRTADLVITAVTLAELRVGVAVMPRGRRRNTVAQQIEEIFVEEFGASALPFDSDCSAVYAELIAGRRQAGRPIGALDAQIAAICVHNGASLATRNTRDFSECGVELHDPWTA